MGEVENYFNDLWCQALLMTVRRSCVVGHGLEKKTTSRSLRPLWSVFIQGMSL